MIIYNIYMKPSSAIGFTYTGFFLISVGILFGVIGIGTKSITIADIANILYILGGFFIFAALVFAVIGIYAAQYKISGKEKEDLEMQRLIEDYDEEQTEKDE